MKTSPWQPDTKLVNAFGLSAPDRTGLRTQVETLFSLATTKKEAGMRLALGLKVANFVITDRDGKFSGYSSGSSLGFTYLCVAIAAHSKDACDTLRSLLQGEFDWANRFLPAALRFVSPAAGHPAKMPLPRWRLLHELAGSFGQAGTEYALRMFTKPFFIGDLAPCERNAYFFSMFLEESYARLDHVPAQIDVALAKPEFSPFVHLVGAITAGVGSTSIFGPAAPSGGGFVLDI